VFFFSGWLEIYPFVLFKTPIFSVTDLLCDTCFHFHGFLLLPSLFLPSACFVFNVPSGIRKRKLNWPRPHLFLQHALHSTTVPVAPLSLSPTNAEVFVSLSFKSKYFQISLMMSSLACLISQYLRVFQAVLCC